METIVIDWWWNSYQSSAHKSLCLLRICVVPRKDPSTSRIQRSLEEKDWRGHDREKLQRLWRYHWRADWIRWTSSQEFTTLQLCGKVNDLLRDWGEAPETFTGRILFMSMFNDISCDILFSVQRLHCPGVYLRTKDMENCQYTSLQIIQQLKQFFASFFCQSAQYLRSSGNYMWRIWSSSRSIGWTWCIDGSINYSRSN